MRLLLLSCLVGFSQFSFAQYRCNADEFDADSCATTVFDSGNLASEGPMRNGRQHGEWWYYTEEGLLWMKVLYLDGNYRSDVNYLETAPGLAAANTYVVGWTPDQIYMNAQHWKRHLILFEGYEYPFQRKDWLVLRTSYQYKKKGKKGRQTTTIEHYVPRLATYDWNELLREDERLLQQNLGAVNEIIKLKMLRSDLYRNGTPYSTEFLSVKHNPNELLTNGNGLWIGLQQNRKKYVTIPFKNGLAEGSAVYFDQNGNKSTTGAFSAGLREGSWTEYHENGKTKRSYTFVHDTISGHYQSFHENGTLRLSAYISAAIPGTKTDGSFTTSIAFDLKLYKSISIAGTVQAFESNGNQVFSMNYPYPVVLDASFDLGGKGKSNTSAPTGQLQQTVTNGETTLIQKQNHRYDSEH